MVFVIAGFCAIGFLVGGIPFGYLTGRLVLKDDIRKHGSGNIGATNVGRILGWKWGSGVLFLDALKGLLPTLAAKLILNQRGSEELINLAAILTGICCILGHMYPIWLRLRGGKGVATGLGVVLVIAPLASGVALAVFLIVFALKRIVGLASVVAAVAFSITQLVRLGNDAWTFEQLPMTLFSTLVPALIVWKHRSNLVRILRGDEPPMKMRSTDETRDAGE
ncbi:MAG TPA: glycerol-3-phosphate 1-O-acyltransferase PlsY [Planctomycetaceae bacterium]|nr:glycerol-3-phosphate 1-O-acyltransferase PlsY [Planctomycetaceae bacterium]HQZ64052.1 glycerol-3-phosphate 1-O-acyltransferase PlsY [Planctomycetaceae bacterium]HRA87902.1 glycerol-3-phosphate 1-O-acyltransferase PlsY [Planctomycetaceae bacterium]